MSLKFTSFLAPSRRRELEELMFMHPQQRRFRETIVNCIDEFGIPKVVEQDGGLRVSLTSQTEVQSLYALLQDTDTEILAGAVIYTRKPADEITVLHIAVKNEFTVNGERTDLMVTFRLLETVAAIARRIQGVRGVRLAYSRGSAAWRNVII